MTHTTSNRREFLKTSLGIAVAGAASSSFQDGLSAGTKVNQAPAPWVPGSWTLAVLPDTQRYTVDPWTGIFPAITHWLRTRPASAPPRCLDLRITTSMARTLRRCASSQSMAPEDGPT